MIKINTKRKYLLIITFVALFILFVEPVSATADSEFESVNWWDLAKEGLNAFSNILEYAANIVRQGADKIVEMFG